MCHFSASQFILREISLKIIGFTRIHYFKLSQYIEAYASLYRKNNNVFSLQTLDVEFNDTNKQACEDASRPLLAAVEQLTTFAASPEFASIPAKISKEVKYCCIHPSSYLFMTL